MKPRRLRVSGVCLVVIVSLAGCHSSQKTASQSGGPEKTPVHIASPTPLDGGAHTFVPYADKPPLGTPVETH